MDYRKLYEATNNLSLIAENIQQLNSYGFSDEDLSEDISNLQNAINNFRNIPNYIPPYSSSLHTKSNKAYANMFSKEECEEKLQDKRMMDILLDRTSAMLILTNDLVSYLDIYKFINEIKELLDKRELSNSENLSIIKTLCMDLDNFKDIRKYFSKYSLNNSAVELVYHFIKVEYRITGTSTLLSKLQDLNKDHLKELALNDARKLSDNQDIKRILDSNNEVILEELIFYISINETGLKDEIINKLSDRKNNYNKSKDSYEDYLRLGKEESINRKEKTKSICASGGKLIAKIMSYILSLSIFTTAGSIAIQSRSINQTIDCYNSIDGQYTITGIDKLERDKHLLYNESATKGDIILIDLSEKYSNNKRHIAKYRITEKLDNIEDYMSIDLSKLKPFYESDIFYLYGHEEAYRTVGIVTESKTIEPEIVSLFFLMAILISASMDMLLGTLFYVLINGETLTYSLTEGSLDYLVDGFKEFKESLEESDIKKDGTIYDKEELKRRKKELLDMINQYNLEFKNFEQFSDMLEDNGFERQLKRS